MYFLKKITEPIPRSLRSRGHFRGRPRPNFGFHLVFTSFHLELSLYWVSRSFDLGDLNYLRRGSGNFFKSYIFEISTFHVSAFPSNFLLNPSTEEACIVRNNFLKFHWNPSRRNRVLCSEMLLYLHHKKN